MKEVPVKIDHNNQWIVAKLGIGKDSVVFPEPINREIPFKSVIDLAEHHSTLVITCKAPDETIYRIKSVKKVLEILKKLILNSCDAYRILAYFKFPAIRGGVLLRETRWEKGNFVVVRTGIWFVNAAKQIFMPFQDILAIELSKTEVKGKPTDVVRIDHAGSAEVVSSQVLCPVSSLQLLYRFLRDANKELLDMKGAEIDATDKQVAMLVHSGVDSQTIENMLNISHEHLDVIYDKFLSLEIAEVVTIRREIKLAPKGVRYISTVTKSRVK